MSSPRFANRLNGILRTFNVRLRPSSTRCLGRLEYFVKKAVDGFLYLLGPVLILVASAIISGITYTYFHVLLPIKYPEDGFFCLGGFLHTYMVVFFDVNIVFNYALCVFTKNTGDKYQRVVRELADATGFVYPENEEEVNGFKQQYKEKIMIRRRTRLREQANSSYVSSSPPPSSTAQPSPVAHSNENNDSNGVNNPNSTPDTNTTATANSNTAVASTLRNRSTTTTSFTSNPTAHAFYGWMLLGPHEWGFCLNTNQPKPPRSHYDHVTGNLVLNMDHYCPWMFNSVGYFNYRYFCNFLLFVTLGLFYGTIMMYEPFMNSNSPLYRENLLLNREQGNSAATIQHLVPMVPTPEEKGAIAMSFMICLSVGFAVFCLASLHTFLVLTAQTTIEFHANGQKKRLSRQRGIQWINPYDLGMKQNFYQVYGSSRHPLWAIFIPSRREPEYLPVPMAGARGKRHLKGDQSGSGNGSSNGNDRDDEKGSDREEASLLLV